MSKPNIEIYYWGRPNPYASYNALTNDYQWLKAGFSQMGGKEDQSVNPLLQSGRNIIHFPTALVSDKWLSMTSDNIIKVNGLKQWSSVPVVIVNRSETPIEEFNISMVEHLWGNGSSEGGFQGFWNEFKHLSKYSSGVYYVDDLDQPIKKLPTNADTLIGYGNPMSISGVIFGNGTRLNGNYDSTGSFFAGSTSAIWNKNSIAFCPLQNTISSSGQYGSNYLDWNLTQDTWGPSCYGYIKNTIGTSGFNNFFGNPTTTSDIHWGQNADYYSGSNTANGSTAGVGTPYFSPNDCRFERFTTFDNTVNSGNFDRTTHAIGDPRGMGYLWQLHMSSSESNALGHQTINKQTPTHKLFPSAVYSLYSDISNFGAEQLGVSGAYQIIRGYMIYNIYSTGFNLGTTPSLGDSREGAVFGKFFCNVATTGRYY